MKQTLTCLGLLCTLFAFAVSGEQNPDLVYWNTPAAAPLQQRIPANADFWQLIPQLTTQKTQTYCGIASAVTVLNAMAFGQPGDPVYYPYTHVTQDSFFTPGVLEYVTPLSVLTRGISMKELGSALKNHGVVVHSISGDSFGIDQLRERLSRDLTDKEHYILINYHRPSLNQKGGGHWSVLGAYDPTTDRALILDVARYAYPPTWASLSALHAGINTLDSSSGESRGLLIVSAPSAAPRRAYETNCANTLKGPD